MSEHTEAKLKAALFKQLRKDEPDFLILQIATAGAPDRMVVGNGVFTTWECKHGTPHFVSHGNQELVCQRMANQGHCRYILWIDDMTGVKRTLIVHPLHIRNPMSGYEKMFAGHNHKMVSNYIRTAHHAHHD